MNNLEKWQGLSAQQQKVVTLYFRHQLSKLPNRAMHALSKFIKTKSEPKLLFSAIPMADFKYVSLPNIGGPTSYELSNFYNEMVKYLVAISELTSNTTALVAQENRQLLKLIFEPHDHVLDVLAAKATEINYFPVFLAIEKFLAMKPLHKKYRVDFFYKCLGYQHDRETRKPQELSRELSIGVERCRQLANDFVDHFPTEFAFIKKLTVGTQFFNIVNRDSDLIPISNEVREQINNNEQTSFSNKFITKVFGLLLEDTHTVVGYENNSSSRWRNLYLIRTTVFQQFDFYSFVGMVKDRNATRNVLTYALAIKDVIPEYSSGATNNELISILKLIIEQETNLEVNDKSEIIIPQNTPVQLWQYIEAALRELGEARTGHHISTIVRTLKEMYPMESFLNTSLMGTMNKSSKFIYFNRNSDYGLKDWEETGYIKGGTIRDIVYEFIEGQNEPKHIHDIVQFVNKYRDTEQVSVYSNLKLEENSKFVFFGSQYVGIPTKDYSQWQQPVKIAGGLFTRKNLQKFDGKPLDEFKSNFIARGYYEVQIMTILNRKIIDKEIVIDEQGLFWLNKLQNFAESYDDIEEEVNVNLTLLSTREDELEQEILTTLYSSLSKTDIIARLDEFAYFNDEKIVVNSARYKRNNAAVVLIKKLRDFKCQICEHTITKKDGSLYIEAAHIIPKYQKGEETRQNILLLCPNHHKEFDLGDLNSLIRTSISIEFILNGQPHIIPLDKRSEYQ